MGVAPSMAATQHQTRNGIIGFNFLQSLAAWLEVQLDHERERLALWVPVLFGGAIALWFALGSERAWIGALCVFSALIFIGFCIGKIRRTGQILIIGGGAALLGLLYIWARAVWIAAPVLAYPVTTEFSAQVEVVEVQGARDRIRLLVRPIDRGDLPPLIRLTATMQQATNVSAGHYIGLRARLTPPPKPALPGGYDFARRAWFDGIGAVGTILGPIARGPATGDLGNWAVRQRLTDHIHRQVDGRVSGIAAALVTGDRGAISDADEEAMRRSGLAHLLSISGLHVTAVIGFTMLATLRILALWPRLALAGWVLPAAAAVAALVGGGYTMLAGAEVPTLRSFIASLLILVAILMGRDAVTLRLVAAGALLVLLWRPDAVVSASFQLSFVAVATIVALHEHPKIKAFAARRDEDWLRRILRALAVLLITGLAVELALTPIGLFHFHKSGIYGALANMIAIPLTTFVIMTAEAAGLAMDMIGLGAPFWWVAERALLFLLALAHWVAATPGAVRMMPDMPVLAYALIVAGGCWALIWQRGWRIYGVIPIVCGIILIFSQDHPDLIVSRDGRHVAAHVGDGGYAMLRMGRGGYARDMMMEAAGSDAAPVAMSEWAEAECNADFCRWWQQGEGRKYQILASRSDRWSDYGALIAACEAADIVISDRRLPKACVPRWLLLDRDRLAERGGAILSLGNSPKWLGGAGRQSDHPWNRAEQVSGNDERE